MKVKKDWGDTSIIQRIPKIDRKPPKVRERYRFFPIVFRRNQPCQHLDFGLDISGAILEASGDSMFLLLKMPSRWYFVMGVCKRIKTPTQTTQAL